MSTQDEVRVLGDQALMSRQAAELIVKAAVDAIKEHGRFLMALSGGGTPEPVFRLLAGPAYDRVLDWTAVDFFWGDERCVPPDEPGSNYGQAMNLLLGPRGIPATRIHRIKGEMAPEAAAADYRERLAKLADGDRDWPALDLALMGLGADGHTASLFPGPPADGEDQLAAIAVTGDYDGRPAQRVSLTPPVFNDARDVLFLVTGAGKAAAVAAVLASDADPIRWPVARIHPKPGRLHFFLDQPAAAHLPLRRESAVSWQFTIHHL